MKNILRFMTAAFVIMSFTNVLLASDLEKLKKAAADIRTLSADFIQEKHLKILVKPIVSKGKIYFKAPRDIRWEYMTPVKSLTLMNMSGARVYIWSEGKWLLDRAQSSARGIVMDEINNWFAGRFEGNPAFEYRFQPGPAPQIIMTPREGVDKFISRIVLKLSARTYRIASVEIYEIAENMTRITFRNEKVNTDISDSIFTKP